jgi:hypothetical protein
MTATAPAQNRFAPIMRRRLSQPSATAPATGPRTNCGRIGKDPAEPDWWRILDALLLVTAHPSTGSGPPSS